MRLRLAPTLSCGFLHDEETASPTAHRPIFRGDSEMSGIFMPGDAELLHSRFQCGGFHSENLSRAAVASNAPANHVEDVQKMISFHRFEGLRMRARLSRFKGR